MIDKKSKIYICDKPELMAEWHWEKNDKLSLDPKRLTCGVATKAWWICKVCGNEWSASIAHRNGKKPTGCPKCSALNRAQLRRKELALRENITIMYSYLLQEWDYTKNKNLIPELITKGSDEKIWWKCEYGHQWQAPVGNRIRGHGCPYCSGRLPIRGKTDLATVNPILAKEWNYDKNRDLSPENVTANSHKKVWWKCLECKHEWQASINNRNKKRGCPSCAEYRKVSLPEKAITYYLSKCYPNIENNVRFDWLHNMELDIFIPDLMLGIEYDGGVWHKIEERDVTKDKLCFENGIKLIRIREEGLSKYTTTAVLFETPKPTLDLAYLESVLLNIIDYIKSNLDSNLKEIDVNFDRDYYDILALANIGSRKLSLGYKFPSLLKEWNFDKNGNLDPYNISSGSSRKVWWKCDKGHEWKTTISNRTNISNRNKCPYCQVKRVTKGVNDLVSINAPFLVDWDYEKNTISPDECTLHSGKMVWWKCHECLHEWETTVDARSKSGCFVCSKQKNGKNKSKSVQNIETKEIFFSAREAENKYGLYSGAVSRCCRKERATAGGYHWRFVE